MRRLKNYLRSTMKSRQRLNDVLILNNRRDATKSLDLLHVACDFVAVNDNRTALLGHF